MTSEGAARVESYARESLYVYRVIHNHVYVYTCVFVSQQRICFLLI